MAIQVQWDDSAQAIIRWDFDSQWDGDDLTAAFKTSQCLARSKNQRVDIIPNVVNSKRLPQGILDKLKELDAQLPDWVRLVVVASADTMTRLMIKTFVQVNHIDSWQMAFNVNEARAIILQDREKNP